jgi:hypothetical protein
MFVPHRKHRYPRPVTRLALLVYRYMMFIPHRKHLRASTARYRVSFTLYLQSEYLGSHQSVDQSMCQHS